MMPVPRDTKNRHKLPDNLNPAGTRCVPVFVPDDAEWIAMLYDALATLGTSQRYVWGDDAKTVANRWKTVLYQTSQYIGAGETCSDASQPDEGTCTTLSAHHPAVSYWPNNPVLQPDEPGPYSSRVWRVGNPVNPFEQSGDSYIDPLAFLGIPLSEVFTIGLPYWHVAFDGSGEVDIGLIQVLQGGAMWVFPDGNPLAGDLVSLQYIDIEELAGVEALLSLLEIIGQSDFQIVETVHTVEFSTPGEHSLTGWMIPTVEPAPPFLGIGGGLRSIQLCGDITVIEDAVIPYTLDAQPDGTIRLLADGVPVSTLDLKALLDDDYVNVEGDTMTGTLTSEAAIAQSFEVLGVQTGKVTHTASQLRYQYNAGKAVVLQGVGASGSEMSYQDALIQMRHRRDFANYPPTGAVRIGGYYASTVVAIMQSLANFDLLSGYDASSVLRSALTYVGKWQSAGYDGYDYSSTAWRKQFGLSGDWLTATDAIRQGIVKLHVSGYDGDHEVFTAEYGESISELPAIAYFGHTPNTRQALTPSGLAGTVAAVVSQLNDYGFVDIVPSLTLTETTGLTDAQRCNIATYMASNLADTIEQIFTNLSTLTLDEFLTGLIEDFGVQVGGVEQMLAQAQVNASYFDEINGDLDDEEAIRDALLDCDFDQACFFAWIDNTSPYIVQTKNIVKTLLALTWDTRVKFWTQVGMFIDGDACGDGTLPCDERRLLDLRWGSAQGAEIQKGVLSYDIGVVNEFEDPTYGVFINLYFDDCGIATVKVHWHNANVAQNMQVWGYDDSGLIYGPFFGTTSLGDHIDVFSPVNQPAIIKLQVSLENEGFDSGSWISQIEYGTDIF